MPNSEPDATGGGRMLTFTGAVVLGAGLVALVVLDARHGTLRGEIVASTVQEFLVAAAGWAAIMIGLERSKAPISSWRWLLALGLAARLLFLLSEPTLSDDVYRYLWDGHLVSEGVSPYQFAPGDVVAARDAGVDVAVRPLVNNDSLASPYLPVAHAVFGASAAVLPSQPWVMQLLMIGFDMLAVTMILRLLRALDLPEWRAMLYWLNPLVIIEVAHGAHIDALIVGLAMSGLYATFGARRANAGAGRRLAGPLLVAAATLTRPLTILFAPVLWWQWSGRQRAAWAMALVVPVAVIGAVSGLGLDGQGSGLFGSAREYTRTFRFNSGPYHWLETWLAGRGLDGSGWSEPANLTRLIFAGLVVLAFVVIFVRSRHSAGRQTLRWLAVSLMVYVLATPVLHPWYLLLLLALIPFVAPGRGEPRQRWIVAAPWLVLSVLVFLSYLTYENPARFSEREWVRGVEWIPTLLLVVAAVVVTASATWHARMPSSMRSMRSDTTDTAPVTTPEVAAYPS